MPSLQSRTVAVRFATRYWRWFTLTMTTNAVRVNEVVENVFADCFVLIAIAD